MKLSFLLVCACCFMISTGCQFPDSENSGVEKATLKNSNAAESKTRLVDRIVEASCGQCQFDLDGKGCDLAVRIDGKSYYVDGSSIDEHGDAHGDDGLCNCIRQSKVTGEIKDGRFAAESISVLPLDK